METLQPSPRSRPPLPWNLRHNPLPVTVAYAGKVRPPASKPSLPIESTPSPPKMFRWCLRRFSALKIYLAPSCPGTSFAAGVATTRHARHFTRLGTPNSAISLCSGHLYQYFQRILVTIKKKSHFLPAHGDLSMATSIPAVALPSASSAKLRTRRIIDITVVDPKTTVHLRNGTSSGSAHRVGSTAATGETRKLAQYACPNSEAFYSRSFTLIIFALELPCRLAHAPSTFLNVITPNVCSSNGSQHGLGECHQKGVILSGVVRSFPSASTSQFHGIVSTTVAALATSPGDRSRPGCPPRILNRDGD